MILVTGGAGFVGSHLIPRLVKAGYKVRCLVRRKAEADHLKEYKIELAVGDVTDADSIKKAMKGVEMVVHLVAVLREGKGATYDGVNVQGTSNVVQAAVDEGVKKLVHIGALGAIPDPKYGYIYSKWRAEEVVRSSDLDYTILEPSTMFGQGAGFIKSLVRTAKTFPLVVVIPGSGKTRFQPIWVEDTVSCILQALKGGKSRQTYQIGGPEHLTFEQMLDTVMDAMGVKRLKVHLPIPLLRPSVAIMGLVLSDPPVTQGELTQLDVDNVTDLDAIERQFGFKPSPLKKKLDFLKPA